MKIIRQLNQDEQKDLIKNLIQDNNSVFHNESCDLSAPNDLFKDNDALSEANSNKDRQEKENPYENLAGPSLIYEALDHVRRLNGTKPISKPLKVRYLPDDVKERLKDLEEEFEKEKSSANKNPLDDNSNLQDELEENDHSYLENEKIHNLDLRKYKSFKDIRIGSKVGRKTGNNVDDSLFYKKAMQHVNRMNNEKKAVLAKISKNFKLFLIIIVAFAGYYAYNVYTRSDEELSVSALQAKLPIKLDTYTTLQKVSLDDNSLNLEVIKSKEAFQEVKDLDSALNVYIQSASSNFCKIPLFSDMIKKGRRISVLLKADDNSFDKEFVVSHCDK
ncbi:MAG: hypothetical protein IJ254_01090 [Succinivibrio sp.]|nr:hypothetical protein [Succinivibrio sp.]